ncbi:MAG: NAD(P)/FAD-dependent oxidoreductase [Clostridia bacterium]|nr:NAD(P)/FAD-dependent oxidoreductase [Clostridia bacterium]MBQ5809915.1 NAD(P)/FAD-dependent oxidoreductase [Clostridia bacterium]
MFDVAVIGAGVIGGMTARALSKYDLSICILEKENDVAMGATKANSAIVHAGFDAKENSLKAKLNVAGSKMMENVCKELGVRYKNNGSLVIGFNDEDKAVLEELLVRGNANGVEGLKVLDKDGVKAVEPGLSDTVTCALYAPTGAIVCPYDLAVSAIGNAMDNGAELMCNFGVTSIEKCENGYVLSNGESTVEARFVINCAGIYSDDIAKLVGDDSFEVNARRGEYILLDKECGNLVSHTIFRTPSKMGKGILVSPTVDGNLLLGPTSEDIEEKENKNVTEDGFAQIISKARENIPYVPIGKSITSFCGLRAVGSTGDFIINSPAPAFINAAGIESPGLSASPAIALYIIDLLKEQGLTLTEKEDYEPTRRSMHHFRDASIEEKNEMIKKNASYGKIVCRCECVTEGEILDALRTNPKARDLDGVKRRTRSQMGRCQGGFCTPYITELIAKELDIPFEGVTKFGGSSVINVEKTKGGR